MGCFNGYSVIVFFFVIEMLKNILYKCIFVFGFIKYVYNDDFFYILVVVLKYK